MHFLYLLHPLIDCCVVSFSGLAEVAVHNHTLLCENEKALMFILSN